ncbi:MAG: hypothetical protein QOF60_40 [Actinomycetota bacterium]|nr:hypothetical protein [Actinomycetota bacterium]
MPAVDESELGRFLADAAADDAARARSQERGLRQVAEEEATFAGLALDLAERGAGVIVRTASGRPHRGRIEAVGRDFVVVRDGARPPVFVPLAAITVLRPEPSAAGNADFAGARPAPVDVSLAAALSRLAVERPRVQLTSVGDPEPLAGELRSVGADVATVQLDGEGRLVAHVRLAGLADVVVFDY